MPLMQARLHKALIEAKVSDDTAREAAEEAAGLVDRLASLEGDMKLVKWMLAAVLGLLIPMFFKVFSL
jgi:ribosome maturation protein Sdo1